MGHASHFLSRLDRLSWEHLELALRLYNDSEVMRTLLTQAALPEGIERVAVSLDDAVKGPFVILTREGRFVTCLGAGMHPGPWPVISRRVLDETVQLVQAHRVFQADVAAATAHGSMRSGRLIAKVISGGARLSREDMAFAESVAPFVAVLLAAAIEPGVRHDEANVRSLGRYPDLRRVERSLLRDVVVGAWSLGHLAVVIALGMASAVKGHPAMAAALVRSISIMTTRTASSPIALLGAWALGRCGAHALAVHLEHFNSSDPVAVVEGALAMTVLAVREPNLSAEIGTALKAADRAAKPTGIEALRRRLAHHALVAMAPGSAARLSCTAKGREIYARMTQGVSEAPEIDDATACAVAMRDDRPLLEHSTDADLEHVFTCIAAISNAPVEELYLPRAVSRIVTGRWTSEQTEALIRRRAPKPQFMPLVRAVPRRHEPCACGSGKKFGRCCQAGAGASAVGA